MDPIEKYMDNDKRQTLQAPVNKSLYDRVNKYRQDKNWTWPEFLDGLFKRVLAEAKK